MTSVSEHRIPVTDLHKIVVACPNCQGELALDLAEEKQRPIFRIKETSETLNCPLCKKPFPPAVRDAIAALWDFYDLAGAGDPAITFRVAQ